MTDSVHSSVIKIGQYYSGKDRINRNINNQNLGKTNTATRTKGLRPTVNVFKIGKIIMKFISYCS